MKFAYTQAGGNVVVIESRSWYDARQFVRTHYNDPEPRLPMVDDGATTTLRAPAQLSSTELAMAHSEEMRAIGRREAFREAAQAMRTWLTEDDPRTAIHVARDIEAMT